MSLTSEGFKEVQHDGEEARVWLWNHYSEINAKWKSTRLQWIGPTQFDGRDETGVSKKYKCSPHYQLVYYRSRFRLFGSTEEAVISFSECDVDSILFRRDRWDADYYLRIGLSHGYIVITRTQPAWVSLITERGNVRSREEVRVTYHLHNAEDTNPGYYVV